MKKELYGFRHHDTSILIASPILAPEPDNGPLPNSKTHFDEWLAELRSRREAQQARLDWRDWKTFNAIRRLLKREGFSIETDPRTKQDYPSIAKDHFYGRRGDLEFKAHIYPAGMEFKFFQNIERENKCGGEYDSGKLKKMPYLIRLRFLLTRQKIFALLLKRGFVDTTEEKPRDAYRAVELDRQSWIKTHGPDFYTRPLPSYNASDKDGRLLKDGDVRCWRDFKGYLVRGTVQHHCNNMWWLVTNKSDYWNAASFELFTYQPGMPRRLRWSPERQAKRISAELEKAVKAQNFERAIVLREILKRIAPTQAA